MHYRLPLLPMHEIVQQAPQSTHAGRWRTRDRLRLVAALLGEERCNFVCRLTDLCNRVEMSVRSQQSCALD
jgi:hypothetical protein